MSGAPAASPRDHPVNRLDDVLYQRYRLGIMAFLSGLDRAEFTTLRSSLGLTDGNLNRHLAVLHDAGFVSITKARTSGSRARTWVRLTTPGRAALHAHISTLRTLLDGVD